MIVDSLGQMGNIIYAVVLGKILDVVTIHNNHLGEIRINFGEIPKKNSCIVTFILKGSCLESL